MIIRALIKVIIVFILKFLHLSKIFTKQKQMIEQIKKYVEEVKNFEAKNIEELEQFKIKFLSKKKGVITKFFAEFKNIPKEEKPEYGKVLNELKTLVETKLKTIRQNLSIKQAQKIDLDLTLPGENMAVGTAHPLSIVKREILDIFRRMGFTIAYGPEIEDDWHNFTALNFPHDHPARDMQDTFFVERNPDIILRTHTSNTQIRYMETHRPPLKVVLPGRVFRNEAVSYRSHYVFHQIEGLYVDYDVSFADLKQTLLIFAQEFFGEHTKIRFRPSYFPFTEPSAETDVTCSLCGGEGCPVCKYTGWLEILGCGMVDPNVLKNVDIDPEKFTGYAFGFGIERIAMLKYGIKDLRIFLENDKRILDQFQYFGGK